jgi:hypothetical protein
MHGDAREVESSSIGCHCVTFFLTGKGPEGPITAFIPAVGYNLQKGPNKLKKSYQDLQIYKKDPETVRRKSIESFSTATISARNPGRNHHHRGRTTWDDDSGERQVETVGWPPHRRHAWR